MSEHTYTIDRNGPLWCGVWAQEVRDGVVIREELRSTVTTARKATERMAWERRQLRLFPGIDPLDPPDPEEWASPDRRLRTRCFADVSSGHANLDENQ